MPNLILYSVFDKQAKINFEKNVIQGVKLNNIKEIAPKEIIEWGNGSQFCFWGCKNTAYYKPKINKIKPGDSIMFAKDRNFYITADILGVVESRDLGQYLFNDEIYSYIIHLENVREINISYETLFKELGYSSNLKVNGLFLVNDMRSERFFNRHINVEAISTN